MTKAWDRFAAGAAAATAALLAMTACTAGGSSNEKKGPAPEAKQTITVWHGFTGSNEVNAFNAAVARFHTAHPNITVKTVKGQDDDKITKAISGGDPPDVAVSFTTDNVGKFCSSGAWQAAASPRRSNCRCRSRPKICASSPPTIPTRSTAGRRCRRSRTVAGEECRDDAQRPSRARRRRIDGGARRNPHRPGIEPAFVALNARDAERSRHRARDRPRCRSGRDLSRRAATAGHDRHTAAAGVAEPTSK